jgi:aspartyl-tRNA(Asn)/glutamyl-tRNA(Gln) amidotransferase subunit C
MAANLSVAEVEHIAALAHLELTDDEKLLFARQLADILNYARQIQQLDTSGVRATAYVHATAHGERDDQLRPSLPLTDVLANAPDPAPEKGLFRVPRVLGG